MAEVGGDNGRQLLLQHAFDFADDLRGRLVQCRDATGHLRPQVLGQAGEDGGGLGRLQIGEDQRNCLRMLVLDKGRDLGSIGLFQEVEGHDLEGLHDACDDLGGFLLAKRTHQHLAGGIHAAFGDELLCDTQLMELFDHTLAEVGIDTAHASDFDAKRLDLIGGQVLENLAGCIGAQGDQQNGGFFAVCKRYGSECHYIKSLSYLRPSSP